MKGVNKAIIVGRLGADPEIRYTQQQKAIANLRIATSESWIDKTTKERKEQTEWHRVVFFGRTAEVAGEYLTKGSAVYVEGKIRTRKWQDKSGADRYTTEIHGDNMQILSARTSPGEASPSQGSGEETGGGGGFRDRPGNKADDFDEDDIPF